MATHRRPNPDALLARVQRDEHRTRRGKLRIFFGYAAGVGKTFAMLSAAQREKAEGVDVVVGYVEAHGRPETEGLLEGLEALPLKDGTLLGARVGADFGRLIGVLAGAAGNRQVPIDDAELDLTLFLPLDADHAFGGLREGPADGFCSHDSR